MIYCYLRCHQVRVAVVSVSLMLKLLTLFEFNTRNARNSFWGCSLLSRPLSDDGGKMRAAVTPTTSAMLSTAAQTGFGGLCSCRAMQNIPSSSRRSSSSPLKKWEWLFGNGNKWKFNSQSPNELFHPLHPFSTI